MKHLFRFVALCIVSASFVSTGCQVGPVEEKIKVNNSAIADNLKKTLEGFVKTGQTGSALTSLESDINGLKTTDAAKAAELHKGFMELQQAGNKPEQVKSIAKDMLSKL